MFFFHSRCLFAVRVGGGLGLRLSRLLVVITAVSTMVHLAVAGAVLDDHHLLHVEAAALVAGVGLAQLSLRIRPLTTRLSCTLTTTHSEDAGHLDRSLLLGLRLLRRLLRLVGNVAVLVAVTVITRVMGTVLVRTRTTSELVLAAGTGRVVIRIHTTGLIQACGGHVVTPALTLHLDWSSAVAARAPTKSVLMGAVERASVGTVSDALVNLTGFTSGQRVHGTVHTGPSPSHKAVAAGAEEPHVRQRLLQLQVLLAATIHN